MDTQVDGEEVVFDSDGGCFGCSRVNPHGLHLRFWRRDGSVGSRFAVPDRFHGAPGIAHGGIIATLADEISCVAAFFLRDSRVVTGELSVRYRRPCPVEVPLDLEARIVGEHARYLIIEADVKRDGEVLAQSSGKFFFVRAETA